MAATAGSDRVEIRPLTGLRAVAAALVFLYHFCGGDSGQEGFGHFPLALAQVAWSGVTFFFTLSGFLLVAIYYDRFSATLSKRDLSRYAVRRIARIYPVYVALLLLVFIRSVVRWRFQGADFPDPLDLVSHVTMTHGLIDRYATSMLPAAWSLSIEEQFYFTLPFFLLLAGSRFWIALLLTPVVVWCIGWTLALCTSGMGVLPDWRHLSLFGQFPTFFIGGVLGYFFRAYVVKGSSVSLRVSNWAWFAALAIYVGGAWIFRGRVSWMEGLQGQIIFATCGAAAIIGCLGHALPSRFLGSRWLVYGGKISYAFYLCHQPVIVSLKRWEHLPRIFELVISIALACVLYELIEKPLQKKIVKRALS